MAGMAAPGAADTEKAMKMAQQEMDYRVDLYNRYLQQLASPTVLQSEDLSHLMGHMYRMVASCYDKCMDKR